MTESIQETYHAEEERRIKERYSAVPELFLNTQPTMPEGSGNSTQSKPEGFWDDVVTGLKNSPRNVLGGARDAGQEMIELTEDLWNWAAGKSEYLGQWDAPDLPKIPESESTTGRITRSMAQFLTGFLPWTGGLKVAGVTNGLVRGMAAGAMSEMTVFDPYEDRLSNMIHEVSGWDEGLGHDILSFLEADKGNSPLEARLKAGLEGLVMDGGMELASGVMKALKIVKKRYSPEIAAEADSAIKRMSDEEMETLQKQIEDGRIDADTPEERYTPKAGGEALARAYEKFVTSGDYIELNDVIKKCHFEDDTQIQEFYDAISTKPLNRDSVQSHRKVAETASTMGFSKKEFDKIQVNDEQMAAKVLRARQTVDVLENVMRAIAINPNKTADDYVQFGRFLEMHFDVRQRLLDVKTNIARTLSSFRIKSKTNHGLNYDEVAESVLQQAGGKQKFQFMMQKMADMQNPVNVSSLVNASKKKNFVEHMQSYWINSLLSGPSTHMRNIVGNLSAQVFKGMELGTAAMRVGGETSFKDLGAYMHGMVGGALEAIGLPMFKQSAALEYKGSVWKTLLENEGVIDQRTFMDSTTSGVAEIPPKTFMGKAAKWAGHAITMPSRTLATGDEFFKTMAYRADLRMQASIAARNQSEKSRLEFMEAFLNDPPSDAVAQASKEMRVMTFQNDGGKFTQALQKMSNEQPLLKFAMPFVRTPVNILKYVGHRTPLINRFSKQMQEDIAAGGVRKEMAEARVALGSTLYGLGLMLAANGTVTGVYDKKKHRSAQWTGSGAGKLKIGDRVFDISTSDPIGAFFIMAADTFDLLEKASADEIDNYMGACTALIASNLSNRSYLQGLGQLLTALTGDGLGSQESKMEWYTKQFVGSFVPNLMKQINRSEFDDTMHENRNLLDSIRNGVIGQSNQLAPKLNPITGEIRKYGDSGFIGLQPFYANELSGDPLMQELARKEIPFEGVDWEINGVELSPEKKNEWTKWITQGAKDAKGRTMQQALRSLVKSKMYQEAPDRVSPDDRRRTKDWMLQRIMSRYRTAGKRLFLRANPDVNQQILMRKHGV